MFFLIFRAEDPNHYKDRWFTSRVEQRVKPNLIITKSGPYVLEGMMNARLALQNQTPQFIVTAFRVCICKGAFF